MKLSLFLVLAFASILVTTARSEENNVTLLDGERLERVRILFVDEVTEMVFLTHKRGVGNMHCSLFPAAVIAGAPIWNSRQGEMVAEETPRPPGETVRAAIQTTSRLMVVPDLHPSRPVQVRGSTRKDGTYVPPHTRSRPTK